MSTATAARQQSERADYEARIACTRSEWSIIQEAYLALEVDDATNFHPSFFLAHVCPSIWHPTVILVYGPDQMPAGIMFLEERTVHGIRSGLFFGDASLGLLITSKKHGEEKVFRAALAALLKTTSVRGLRLLASPSGYEVQAIDDVPMPANLAANLVPTERHQLLRLAPTYEQFLTGLSYKTRRNFRYFRNRSGNAGNNFTDNLSFEEFVPAAWKLQSEQTVGGYRSPLERALAILKTARRPLLVALKSKDEELLSFVAGWWLGSRAVIFMQLNSDKRYPKDSLSLTMRTYLIEYLIENRCSEVIWWSGVSEPIKNYCEPVPTVAICLDNQGSIWRMSRTLLESIRSRIPKRFHALAEMLIAPARLQNRIQ